MFHIALNRVVVTLSDVDEAGDLDQDTATNLPTRTVSLVRTGLCARYPFQPTRNRKTTKNINKRVPYIRRLLAPPGSSWAVGVARTIYCYLFHSASLDRPAHARARLLRVRTLGNSLSHKGPTNALSQVPKYVVCCLRAFVAPDSFGIVSSRPPCWAASARLAPACTSYRLRGAHTALYKQ